jgi:hypothetical protein
MEANLTDHSRTVWCSILAFTVVLLFTPLLNAQNQHIFDKPYSGGYLAAKAFKAGQLRLQGGTQNRIAPPSLTCSPAPCAFTPVDASEGGSLPVNEDPIAVNPTNSSQILTGGNDYNCGNIQGFFASGDGGTTWTHVCSPGSGGQGDPIVGYDLNNVAHAGGIQNGSVVGFTSTNNGMTWSAPTTIITAQLGYLADKPWMEIDTNSGSAFKNDIYVSTTQFASNSNSQIWVSHSTDGGKTWSSVAVSSLATYPGHVNQFSDLAVGGDGTVYANWINCPTTSSSGNCGGTLSNIMFSKSTDGGKTWSKESLVGTVTLVTDNGCCFYGQLPNTSERVSDIPSNAVFGSGSTAKVYVSVYNWTGTLMQQEVITSTNGGSTWGSPVIVNPTSTKGDQFFQWLNVNSAGTLGVTWLDRRNDPSNLSYQPFFAFSKTSGKSFSKGHALSKSKSNPDNDGFGGSFMGDYTGNAWSGTLTLYQSYMDTTTKTCQDFVTGVLF